MKIKQCEKCGSDNWHKNKESKSSVTLECYRCKKDKDKTYLTIPLSEYEGKRKPKDNDFSIKRYIGLGCMHVPFHNKVNKRQ